MDNTARILKKSDREMKTIGEPLNQTIEVVTGRQKKKHTIFKT